MVSQFQPVSGEWRPGASIGYVAVVCTVIWVTLDLDQPQRGWITVSREPMRRLLEGMRAEDRPDPHVPDGVRPDAGGQR